MIQAEEKRVNSECVGEKKNPENDSEKNHAKRTSTINTGTNNEIVMTRK